MGYTSGDASSLRRRRSHSPQKRKHEETQSLTGHGSPSKRKADVTGEHLCWTISIGAVLLFVLLVVAMLAYWLVVFVGIYDPDSDCPVPTFDYPDCSQVFMHRGEVAPPLTFDQFLDLRERYHRAMQAGGKGARSSLADDWQEPNTYGFADLSSIEFRFSPGKGRAVFAVKPIPKGAKIWDSRYRAVFPNGCVGKLFFANQTNQQKCDALFWGYNNNFYGNGIQYMFDLDGHAYINHDGKNPNSVHHFEGELDKDRNAVSRLRIPSLGMFPLTKDDWERRNRPGAYGLYALRDIEEGEELLYNYDEIYMYGWGDWYTIFLQKSLPIWEWQTI